MPLDTCNLPSVMQSLFCGCLLQKLTYSPQVRAFCQTLVFLDILKIFRANMGYINCNLLIKAFAA